MVNTAIIAGLVAGYTVSAVVTALLVAEDAPVDDHAARFAAAGGSGRTACVGALRRGRGAARCLVGRSPDRFVTTQRR